LQIRIEDLKGLEDGVELACLEGFSLVDMEFNGFALLLNTFLMEEAYLFEIEDKVGDVSDYSGDGSKFMINTTDLDRADSISLEAAEQHAADSIAYRNSVPRFEWAKLKDTFVRTRLITLSGLMKFNIAMNLMII